MKTKEESFKEILHIINTSNKPENAWELQIENLENLINIPIKSIGSSTIFIDDHGNQIENEEMYEESKILKCQYKIFKKVEDFSFIKSYPYFYLLSITSGTSKDCFGLNFIEYVQPDKKKVTFTLSENIYKDFS